jgi:hypothetical protein
MKCLPADRPPLAISFTDFYTREYPCSRAHANNLIKRGELETFRDGNRRMVLYSKAREFVERKAAAGGAVAPEESAQKSAAGKLGKATQRAIRESERMGVARETA